MDHTFALLLLLAAAYAVKSVEQRQRIALLSRCLQPYQLEKLMEELTAGYLRALDEPDTARQQQIWQLLENSERRLSDQFSRLAADVARLGEVETRISRWPLALPGATRLLAGATIDLRQAIAAHAAGMASVTLNTQGLSPRAKAYRLSAELFLFQHTCHWFCRSRAVASARLLRRHKVSHDQVLDAVSPETRRAWQALLNR